MAGLTSPRLTAENPSDFLYPSEEEEEEGSYDTDEGQDYRAQPPRDVSSSSVTGPSPSSVVKLEANQKARNKKQRQELYGETAVKPRSPSATFFWFFLPQTFTGSICFVFSLLGF